MKYFRNITPFTWFLSIISLFLGIYIYFIVDKYLENFGTDYSIEHDKWGQFGDYFGGMVNPIISLISLIVLAYIAVLVSRNEERREQALLNAQRDIEYHVLLTNIRHNQYPNLLNEYILKLEESSNPNEFVHQLKELKKKRDRISFMFEWEKTDEQFAELETIKQLIEKENKPQERINVFNEQLTSIQTNANKIKTFIQKSILSPVQTLFEKE